MNISHKLKYLIVLTCILNAGIFSIPFLGDEVQGLLNNSVIRDPGTFWERMFTLKGFFQRPLSVLSFTLNFQISGQATWSYHLFNLVIHLFNLLLVYLIAEKIAKHPLFAAAIFAVHPLSTSCVAQIYGRPYSLGSMWMCLALYLLLRDRDSDVSSTRLYLSQFFLWLMMLLSKQVFVFYPVFMFWIIYTDKKSRGQRLRVSYLAIIGFLLAVAMLIGVFQVHVIENLPNSPVSPRVFMYSQLGNFLWILGSIYYFPVNFSLFHELTWYNSFFSSYWPVVGLLSFSLLLCTALFFRHNILAVILFGFLIAYLPTNSVVPKGEVLMEWRLYPSLVFFSLGIGVVLSNLYECLSPLRSKAVVLLVAVFIGLSAFVTVRQNYIYSSVERTYQQVISKYPGSAVAENGLGYHYLQNQEFAKAEQHLLRANSLKPSYQRPIANLYLLYSRWGRPEQARQYLGKVAKQRSRGSDVSSD